MKRETDPVIVIIATSMNRTEMFIQQSLRSVYEQEDVNPKAIFVVDDNKKQSPDDRYSTEYHNIKKKVKEFRKEFLSKKLNIPEDSIPQNYFHTTVIPNTRTHGNSGTGPWNTAAFRAMSFGKTNYLAFLDDDDEWAPSYLKKCLAQTERDKYRKRKEFVAAVISGVLRKEPVREMEMIPSQETFTRNHFFAGNPGFQGSNMFIQLKTFWSIGGFDESMASATDRDLALRLIEYANVLEYPKFKFIDECLVIHHVHPAGRVTSDPHKKQKGLDIFYRKYLHLMDESTREKSLERANRLFDYTLSMSQNNYSGQEEVKSLQPTEDEVKSQPEPQPFNLLIGLISDSTSNVREFLKSFMQTPHKSPMKDYQIVILENTSDEYRLRPIIQYFKGIKKLNVHLITIEQQEKDCSDFPFHMLFKKEDISGKSIAFSRSLLQWYLSRRAKKIFDNDCVCWIVDDDHMLEGLFTDRNNTSITVRQPDFLEEISRLKENSISDVVLGTVTDAPPLPFLSSVRTQLVDMYFNLSWFARQCPEEGFQCKYHDNHQFIRDCRDFYYDLSSDGYTHLEAPFWWFPLEKETPTIYDAFEEFLEEIILVGKGVNVFRPIVTDDSKWGNVTGESILRGGNTLVFDPDALRLPNFSPRIDWNGQTIVLRRSDFIWAILQKYIYKRKIHEIVLPLRHHRRLQNSSFIFNEEKLVSDIYGLVFYRTIISLLAEKDIHALSERDIRKAANTFKSKLKETITKLKINNLRSQFLSWRIIHILGDYKNWWFDNKYRPQLNNNIQKALSTVRSLEYEIGKRKFQMFLKSVEKNGNRCDAAVFRNFLEDIKRIMEELPKPDNSSKAFR
ncbi:MAG: hypothetical protein KAU14_03375 [Thermoplasmata archaeon]|nr:hypothetical protein [Thermoplasmata archaeon]